MLVRDLIDMLRQHDPEREVMLLDAVDSEMPLPIATVEDSLAFQPAPGIWETTRTGGNPVVLIVPK